MALALTSVGYFMYLDIGITRELHSQTSTIRTELKLLPFSANAVVASVIIFNAAFGMSWGELFLTFAYVNPDHRSLTENVP